MTQKTELQLHTGYTMWHIACKCKTQLSTILNIVQKCCNKPLSLYKQPSNLLCLCESNDTFCQRTRQFIQRLKYERLYTGQHIEHNTIYYKFCQVTQVSLKWQVVYTSHMSTILLQTVLNPFAANIVKVLHFAILV